MGSDEKRIVVVGAGVAGLGAALALSRDGHQVTLLERDATPLPPDPSSAFEWDRRGAPQVRHSHAFLARLYNLLRTSYPDVLADLLAAGATEIRMAENLPPTMTDWTPRPGDEELVMLACRRTTFEWVLRRSVLASPRCSIRDGVAAEGLLGSPGADGIPVVTGVRTSAGDFPADLTVVAGGRRSTLPDWLAEIGAEAVPEEVEDTGIVYYSRFYELLPGAEPPPRDGPIGGDLGYLKYAIFQGDNGTFSITLATPTDDSLLRGALVDDRRVRHDGGGAARHEGVGRSRGLASDHRRALDGGVAQPAAHLRGRRPPTRSRSARSRRRQRVHEPALRTRLLHRLLARASARRRPP